MGILLLSIALVGCTILLKISSRESIDQKTVQKAWSRVLKNHMDSKGRIDFHAVKKLPRRIHKFVVFIAANRLKSSPELVDSADKVMAYYLNSYNALAMYGVIEAGIPRDFGGFINRLSFFKLREFIIGGKEISLFFTEDFVNSKQSKTLIEYVNRYRKKKIPANYKVEFIPYDWTVNTQ